MICEKDAVWPEIALFFLLRGRAEFVENRCAFNSGFSAAVRVCEKVLLIVESDVENTGLSGEKYYARTFLIISSTVSRRRVSFSICLRRLLSE